MKKSKLPQDLNKRAMSIVNIATGENGDTPKEDIKNPAAMALGRLGGLNGGKARASNLSSEKRKEIATKAVYIRWKKG